MNRTGWSHPLPTCGFYYLPQTLAVLSSFMIKAHEPLALDPASHPLPSKKTPITRIQRQARPTEHTHSCMRKRAIALHETHILPAPWWHSTHQTNTHLPLHLLQPRVPRRHPTDGRAQHPASYGPQLPSNAPPHPSMLLPVSFPSPSFMLPLFPVTTSRQHRLLWGPFWRLLHPPCCARLIPGIRLLCVRLGTKATVTWRSALCDPQDGQPGTVLHACTKCEPRAICMMASLAQHCAHAGVNLAHAGAWASCACGRESCARNSASISQMMLNGAE